MLAVGDYDEPVKNLTPRVYAFFHGDKKNQIGYFYTPDDVTFVGIPSRNLNHVDFEELFCDLSSFAHVRAMALYYFLTAGYIDVMGNYSTFWADFKRACGWIANKGSRPTPHPKREGSNVVDQFAINAKEVPTLDKQATVNLGRRLNIPASAAAPQDDMADRPAFPLIKRELDQNDHSQERESCMSPLPNSTDPLQPHRSVTSQLRWYVPQPITFDSVDLGFSRSKRALVSLDHQAPKNRSYTKAQMLINEPAKFKSTHNKSFKAMTPPPKARCCGCRSSSLQLKRRNYRPRSHTLRQITEPYSKNAITFGTLTMASSRSTTNSRLNAPTRLTGKMSYDTSLRLATRRSRSREHGKSVRYNSLPLSRLSSRSIEQRWSRFSARARIPFTPFALLSMTMLERKSGKAWCHSLVIWSIV
jgi:hypothetical protein